MDGKDAFQQRLARLAEKHQSNELSEPAPRKLASTAGKGPIKGPGFGVGIGAGLGLVGVAIGVAMAWPDLKPMFVAESTDPVRQGSYLERSLLNGMTDEEIERMDNDPDLQGLSRMGKLIMSN